MADNAALDPTTPLQQTETLEQRLTRKLAGYRARLRDIESTRPSVGAGEGIPADVATIPGAQWLNISGRRFYVYAGDRWVSSDAARGVATASGTVSTASTSAVDLGGPTLTIYIPDPGIIGIQADVESQAFWAAPGSIVQQSYAVTEIRDNTLGTSLTAITENNVDNLFHRRLSFPAGGTGGTYPIGGLWVARLGAGVHTWSLRHRTQALAGAPATVSFRNRTLWAVAL